VEAFALGELDPGAPAGFVMPGTKGRAQFHRAEDVDQAGLRTPPGQHLGDAVLLPEVLALDEFDLQSCRPGQLPRVVAPRVPQRLRENAQVKASNAGEMQLSFQGRRLADVQQTARDDHPVKAIQLTHNL